MPFLQRLKCLGSELEWLVGILAFQVEGVRIRRLKNMMVCISEMVNKTSKRARNKVGRCGFAKFLVYSEPPINFVIQ